MSLSDYVQQMADDLPSNRTKEPLPPLPPRPRIPARHGEAIAETGNGGGGGGGGIYFEENNIQTREWHAGGFVSSDGIFYFPAIRKVKNKFGEYLQFAAPSSGK